MPQTKLARFLDEQYVISDLPYLEVGESITLCGVKYTIIDFFYPLENLPDGFYYKAINEHNEKFIIKIHFKFRNANMEPKAVVLTHLMKIRHTALGTPIEFGTGIKKYKFKYCFEIYAMPSDLVPLSNVDISPAAVKSGFLPQIKELFEYLHKNDIYLPFLHISNFFVSLESVPKVFIFGYGHALMKSKFPFVEKTPYQKNNLCRFFYAPEIFDGMYSESSDYYSVGMILLKIFYPNTFEVQSYNAILENGKYLKPLIEYKTDFYEVNSIIEGLTIFNEIDRFSSNKIDDIVSGRRVVPQYYGNYFLFKDSIKDVRLHNLGDLIDLIKLEPLKFINFIAQPQKLKSITDWLNNLDGVNDLVGLKKRLIRYQNFPPEYFIEIILRHLLPSQLIKLQKNEFVFDDLKLFDENLYKFFRNLEHLHFYLTDFDIKFAIFQLLLLFDELSDSDKTKFRFLNEVKNKITDILGINKESYIDSLSSKSFSILPKQFVKLFHVFIPKKYFRTFEGMKLDNIKDFAYYLAQHPEVLSDEYLYNDMVYFLKWNGIEEIRVKTYKDIVFEILESHVECNVTIARIEESEAGKFKIIFSYRYSLIKYFKSLKLDLPFTSEVKQQHSFEFKNKGVGSAKKAISAFFANLANEHKLKTDKIPPDEIAQIEKKFKDTFQIELNWKTIVANILIASLTGYILSQYGLQLFFTEKIRWYLSLMPEFDHFLEIIFPYILSFSATALLYILSHNLKLFALFVFFLILSLLGGSYFIYENNVANIEDDLSFKKEILSDFFKGKSNDQKSIHISSNDLKEDFDLTFGKINSGFRPLVDYNSTDSLFFVNSDLKVISRFTRKLEDDSYAAKFSFVESNKFQPEKLTASSPIPDNNGLLSNGGYFSFKMVIDNVKIEGDDNSIFGVAFNHYFLILSKKKIILIKKSEENVSNESTFLLLSEMQDYDYNIESSGLDKELLPAGIVEKVYDFKELAKSEFNVGSSNFKLEVLALFASVIVKINDKQVLIAKEKNGFADLDYDKFKPNISIVFGMTSKYSLNGLNLYVVQDPSGDKNYLARTPIKCSLVAGIKLFNDSGLSDKSNREYKSDDEFYIRKKSGNSYQIESKSGDVFYVGLKDILEVFY